MTILRYGNTNTFFIEGNDGGLLVDTDYAGTLPAFYKALKQNGIKVNNIKYVLATHYHPDHMGLISDLMKQGAMLILIDVQRDYVHFSDSIFARDRLPYTPIDESLGTVISCSESREFLLRAGISGEIIHTHSHSEDSVSLIMDDGDCFVGDLEPFEYIEVYEENESCVIPLRQIDISNSDKYVMADLEECENGLKVTNVVSNPEMEDSPSEMAIMKGGIFTSDIFDYLDENNFASNYESDFIECYYGFIKSDKLYGCIMLGEKLDVVSSMGVLKGNIIATLSDNRYREEMLKFLKDIVDE